MFKTYHVSGRNGYTIYNIQARTDAKARQIFRQQTGEAAMKSWEA